MTGVDWQRVSELVQMVEILTSRDAADQLKQKAQLKIHISCATAEAMALLFQLAGRTA